MAIEYLLLLFFALAIGDIMAVLINQFYLVFTDKKQTLFYKSFIKNYLNYVLSQLSTNRNNFICYSALLYITSIIISYLCYKNFGLSIQGFLALLFCCSITVLSFVDARTGYLPDLINKPLIIIGIILGYFEIFIDLKSSIIGAMSGYLSLWSVNAVFKILRKKDGMGYGDFKLLCAIGAWVGWYPLAFIVLTSSIIGIFVALSLTKFANNKLSQPSPFGPSLAIASVISLFWGNDIINWYISLYS